MDGLRSALILHHPNETTDFKYSSEYTVGLSDWYQDEHPVLLKQYLSIFNPTGAEPIPNAPLLNEKTTEVFSFVPGNTYRLRFIAMTALSMFNVWIEVDGIDVEPYEVDALQISAAQRYSVLVTAKNTSDFNYLINAQFNVDMFDAPPEDLVSLVTAKLEYSKTAPTFIPAALAPELITFDDTKLVPLIKEEPLLATKQIILDMAFSLFDDGINHGTFNNIVYQHGKVPPMFSALSMGQKAKNPSIYGASSNVFVLNHLEVVEIVINNNDPGSHPLVRNILC